MPITEFITPLLKQDAASLALFQLTLFPKLLTSLSAAPGFRLYAHGSILEEDGIGNQDTFKPVLGLSWKNDQDFYSFLGSQEFQAFGGQMKPLALAPAQPQLFETNLEPDAVFSSVLTEVYRIKIPNETVATAVKDSWREFDSAIVKAATTERCEAEAHLISGTSLNLEEKTFVGVIGWRSAETREAILKSETVTASRTTLLGFDATRFLMSLRK